MQSREYARIDYEANPLPVDLGLKFAIWIMSKPEICDIVYRRFVLEDFDNKLDAKLLANAALYFEVQNGFRSVGLRQMGIYTSLASQLKSGRKIFSIDKFRGDLLKRNSMFTDTTAV